MNMHLLRSARLLGAALAIATVVALGGCSNSEDAARIAELEQQVEELQAEKDAGAQTDAASTEQGAAKTDDAADEQAALDADPTLADFSTRVDELVAEFEAVEPTSDRDADFQTYLDMESKANALDEEMDRYDDELERAVRAGDMTREDYRAAERELDRLDDRLSAAEDSLEYRLGVDD